MRPKTNRLLMLLIGAMLAGCASQTERSSSGGGAEQAQAPAPTPAPAPAYEPQSENVQFVDRPLEETPPPPPAPVAKAPEQPLPDFPITKYEVEPEEEVEDLGTQPDESGTMQYPEQDLAAKDSVVGEPTEVADEPEEEVGDLGTQPDESGTMSYPEQQLASEKVISEPTQYADQVRVAFEAEPLFSFDKSAVRSDQRSKLDEFVASLKGTQYDSVSVIGYADRIGSEDYNQKLSERRANAAKNYLVREGIPAGKITAVGRGESEPVTGDTCSGQRGKALIACLEPDRRADVSVTATKPAN
jgi:outer membrane protein OmpA-like peptidoglycan-associated protein